MTYKAKPVSRAQIREFVHKFKKYFNIEGRPYFDILEFLEIILPKAIPGFHIEILEEKDMRDCYAYTVPYTATIYIRSDVYEGAAAGNPRDRFTLAHETGHLFLHPSQAITLCKGYPNQKLKAYEDPEWQANTFAGELLADVRFIKYWDIDTIMRECVVSKQTAEIQFKYSCQM